MWKKRNGEYYLYDSNDNLIAGFAMSTVYKVPRAMWVNSITGETNEFEVPDGNVGAAMSEIEDCIIDYCNNNIRHYRYIVEDIVDANHIRLNKKW